MESAGLWPTADVTRLTNAYRDYRGIAHRAALQERRAMIDAHEMADARRHIAGIWARCIERVAVPDGTPKA